MANIILSTSTTTGNTTVSGVTLAISTSSDCELIVLTVTTSGTGAIGIVPKLGNDFFTKAGATVATTEGNVEIWYMTTNTQSRSGFVSYSNKSGYAHVSNLYSFTSLDSIIFQAYNTTFSVNGSTASIVTHLGSNTGGVVINQFHSGYPSLSGVSKSGTLLHQLDRGDLICGSAYGTTSGNTDMTLHWTTPTTDDYAMAQVGFISGNTAPPVTGDITSWNSIAFADMNTLNSVSLTSLGGINTIDTGN